MKQQPTIEYRPSPTSHVYIKWGTMIHEKLFRDGMDKIIELMKEHKTGKVLSNASELGALTEADQKWSIDDWLPRALAVGYSAIATIVSEELFGRMAVEDVLNNASEKSPIQVQYFEREEEKALEWLVSLNSQK